MDLPFGLFMDVVETQLWARMKDQDEADAFVQDLNREPQITADNLGELMRRGLAEALGVLAARPSLLLVAADPIVVETTVSGWDDATLLAEFQAAMSGV